MSGDAPIIAMDFGDKNGERFVIVNTFSTKAQASGYNPP
jgi:hypothetical protein